MRQLNEFSWLKTVVPAEIVFVSSNRWDVMGASACGYRTAWVNRASAPQEYAFEVDNLQS